MDGQARVAGKIYKDVEIGGKTYRLSRTNLVGIYGDVEAWKILRVPKDKRAFIKADHYCVINDDYHYPISKSDELGVVMGLGDTAQEAIDHLKENFKAIEDEFASIDIIALAELLQKAQDGKEHGVNFSDAPIPEPEEVVS